ncbi:MAG: hypothetical protein SFW09_12365 [Hyphomicrobiaceae bacterium]|nr:hypothetical protein [Hyphomicrobiaceae bacterium]
MQHDPSGGTRRPSVDLDTVRETLVYMRDDMSASADMAGVRDAMDRVLREIDAVCGATRSEGGPRHATVVPFPALRLVPWSPAG